MALANVSQTTSLAHAVDVFLTYRGHRIRAQSLQLYQRILTRWLSWRTEHGQTDELQRVSADSIIDYFTFLQEDYTPSTPTGIAAAKQDAGLAVSTRDTVYRCLRTLWRFLDEENLLKPHQVTYFHHTGPIPRPQRRQPRHRAATATPRRLKSTTPTAPLSISIDEAIEQYIESRKAKGLSPRTIHTYSTRLAKFTNWLGDRDLTRPVIRSYLAYLSAQGIERISVQGYFRDVCVFCNWLVDEEFLTVSPARKLLPRVPKRQPASYTREQVQKLLAMCDARDRAIIITLLDTGLRASELCSLRRDSVDVVTGRFRVIGKGNKERIGWLDPYTREMIAAYLATRRDHHQALWVGNQGPLTPNGIHQIFGRRADQAGIRDDVRRLVHAWRATFAKNYLLQGGDLESLRKLLGHESIAMSAHYAQLADSELAHRKATVNPLAAMINEAA